MEIYEFIKTIQEKKEHLYKINSEVNRIKLIDEIINDSEKLFSLCNESGHYENAAIAAMDVGIFSNLLFQKQQNKESLKNGLNFSLKGSQIFLKLSATNTKHKISAIACNNNAANSYIMLSKIDSNSEEPLINKALNILEEAADYPEIDLMKSKDESLRKLIHDVRNKICFCQLKLVGRDENKFHNQYESWLLRLKENQDKFTDLVIKKTQSKTENIVSIIIEVIEHFYKDLYLCYIELLSILGVNEYLISLTQTIITIDDILMLKVWPKSLLEKKRQWLNKDKDFRATPSFFYYDFYFFNTINAYERYCSDKKIVVQLKQNPDVFHFISESSRQIFNQLFLSMKTRTGSGEILSKGELDNVWHNIHPAIKKYIESGYISFQ